jgi:hypothetical protein
MALFAIPLVIVLLVLLAILPTMVLLAIPLAIVLLAIPLLVLVIVLLAAKPLPRRPRPARRRGPSNLQAQAPMPARRQRIFPI